MTSHIGKHDVSILRLPHFHLHCRCVCFLGVVWQTLQLVMSLVFLCNLHPVVIGIYLVASPNAKGTTLRLHLYVVEIIIELLLLLQKKHVKRKALQMHMHMASSVIFARILTISHKSNCNH
jgi:hypothetical protein